MIVLGPSISVHHLLEDNDEDNTDEQNYESTPNSNDNDSNTVESSLDNCASMSSVPQDDELQIIGEDLIHLLNDIRKKCSVELGLIGAPPLSSSTKGNQSTKQLTTANILSTPTVSSISNGTNKTSSQQVSSTYQTNLSSIHSMASTHTNLIQTVNNILETISLGASLRLGLGPNNSSTRGNMVGCSSGRLVARVEKNWVARQQHLKQQPQSKSCISNAQSIKSNRIANTHQQKPIRLTLQKIRNILHQTIVDYAISLQEILKNADSKCKTSTSTTNEWEDFISDLQHSINNTSTSTHILTISQLTIWINHLGSLLSFILSIILDRDGSMVLLVSDSPLMASVKQSIQFANERIAFLHSACPLCQSQDNDIILHDTSNGVSKSNITPAHNDNDVSNISRNQQKRQAKQMIQNLQATLDAARVSLWSFEQSYTDQDDTINDTASSDRLESNHDAAESDDIAWWSQFKDLMERSQSTIPEFESQFLPTVVDEDAEQEELVEEVSNISASRQVTTECSELISTGEELSPTTAAGVESEHPSLPVNKTLVFSGSGTKLLNKKRIVITSPAEQDSSPPTFNAVDQTRLLQDLQSRIKTIGFAEEHVVVNADPQAEMIDTEDRLEEEQAKGSAALSSNKGNDKRQSQSCFLGVSGSLLAELSSTIGKSSLTSPEE